MGELASGSRLHLESPPSALRQRLEQDGLAILPSFVQGETLAAMQRAFESRLRRMRWNNYDGYERTEQYRLMVQDVLTLDQGFVSAALHPVVKETIRDYLGVGFQLVEAKGWKSLPTRKLFHAWHADAWYDQTIVSRIPREVKLAVYLTDVRSGAFRYILRSHRKHQPRDWKLSEIAAFPADDITEVRGPAGTAFLFDTSGIHGQSCPVLEPRHAVFYNYHDPAVPLQAEDTDHYRYHPLALNAAFLGGLDAEDQSILGFGNRMNFQPAFEREPRHTGFQKRQTEAFALKLRLDEFSSRATRKIRRMLGL